MSKKDSVPRYAGAAEAAGPSRNEILAHYGISASADEDPREKEMREWEEQQQRRLTGQTIPAELALELISANPDNPRELLGDLEGLASSLREVGLVTAITVASVDAYLKERPTRHGELEPGTQYVVVDGHRRLAAAREAGFSTLKVTVNDAFAATDESLLEAAFVANAQREGLTELEEAQALQKLVQHYGSQHKVAKRLGLTQPYVSQRISLLSLAPDLQADLVEGRRTVEHVRGLAKLSPTEQRAAADARRAEVPAARKERRNPPVVRTDQTKPDGGQKEAGTDNGVISAELASVPSPPSSDGTDNAVISDAAAEQEAGPLLVDMRRLPRVPWHDGHGVADLIFEKMDAGQQTILFERLSEALFGGRADSAEAEGRGD
ncbi:ParB/RepB/Spo0J family partition protein [Streptomyces goshikiensis]|uniref:ParB/RepB/Spo0J family partition protein n=1 Tax=Streptomyces goshikiensis TaxID=1942 RepID=UPI002ADFEFAB|nr:ParB/RepB/Spo0J family partition protein [Streptomyces goshikiensis]